MAIYRLMQEASFSPEDIARITAAYEAAVKLLRLRDRDEPVAEVVAKKIIEVTRSGVKDPPRICARAIKELGIKLPE
jgi:hypothetical protein